MYLVPLARRGQAPARVREKRALEEGQLEAGSRCLARVLQGGLSLAVLASLNRCCVTLPMQMPISSRGRMASLAHGAVDEAECMQPVLVWRCAHDCWFQRGLLLRSPAFSTLRK